VELFGTLQRNLDHEVAVVEHNLRGKKFGNRQDKFEKILHKQCPMHLKSKHTLFQCISLRNSLNAPLPDQDENRKDKQDAEGDKLGVQGYQDPKNIVNVIFGGDGGFPTKHAQKLTLREILSIEPAILMRTSLLCIQCKDRSLEHVRDSWISRYVLTLFFRTYTSFHACFID
jgi:hypothetical protein